MQAIGGKAVAWKRGPEEFPRSIGIGVGGGRIIHYSHGAGGVQRLRKIASAFEQCRHGLLVKPALQHALPFIDKEEKRLIAPVVNSGDQNWRTHGRAELVSLEAGELRAIAVGEA